MDGEEGEEEEEDDDDDDDDEPDDSAKAMLRHKDDEYVPIDGERRKIGDDNPDDDEDEPTDVQGWRKLAESPSFLCGGMALRSYQLDGLNWMRLSYYLGRNVRTRTTRTTSAMPPSCCGPSPCCCRARACPTP